MGTKSAEFDVIWFLWIPTADRIGATDSSASLTKTDQYPVGFYQSYVEKRSYVEVRMTICRYDRNLPLTDVAQEAMEHPSRLS